MASEFFRSALLAIAISGIMLILSSSTNSQDFTVFRCAGVVALEHQSIFDNAPLNACEVHDGSLAIKQYLAERTLPVPLPGYTLALFIPFALLPYAVAKFLWTALTVFAYAGAVSLLRKLTQASYSLLIAATIVPVLYYPALLGELTAFVFFFFIAALACLDERRYHAGAVFTVAMLIQPHLGLPAVVALFLLAPQCRGWIMAGVAALSALAVIAMPLHENVIYLTQILPLHARAELARDGQLSLSNLLYTLGTPAEIALHLGTLSYAMMLVAAVWTAQYIYRRTNQLPLALSIAPACVLIGGTFIHPQQFTLAIVSTLLFITFLRQRYNPPKAFVQYTLYAALIALATPIISANTIFEVSFGVMLALVLGLELVPGTYLFGGTAAAVNALAGYALIRTYRTLRLSPYAIAATMDVLRHAQYPGIRADEIWRIYVDHAEHPLGLYAIPFKCSLWLATIAVITLGSRTVAAATASPSE